MDPGFDAWIADQCFLFSCFSVLLDSTFTFWVYIKSNLKRKEIQSYNFSKVEAKSQPTPSSYQQMHPQAMKRQMPRPILFKLRMPEKTRQTLAHETKVGS